jgi:mannose-6-phosphate isomerase
VIDRPLLFEPFLRPMVWGGRRLGHVLGKHLRSDEVYGESWELSDHALHQSRVAAGPYVGRSLRDLMETERPALLGVFASRHAVFPWLVKFLDCADWLSVQVHPDEEAVTRLCPGEGSKTEAWYVLDAAPGSRIYAGLLRGVREPRFRDALQHGTVAECMHQFEPRPGDCVFLPAGTVHAVGGGVLLAEVQQTSDATFRLFDWNRKDASGKSRPLHIDEAIAAIHWDQGPVQPVRASSSSVTRPLLQTLVRCPYFTLKHLQANKAFTFGGMGRMQVVLPLDGKGRLETPAGGEAIVRGQVWLLPAAMPTTNCVPEGELTALVASLPE